MRASNKSSKILFDSVIFLRDSYVMPVSRKKTKASQIVDYHSLRIAYERGDSLAVLSERTGLAASALSVALNMVGCNMRKAGRPKSAWKISQK